MVEATARYLDSFESRRKERRGSEPAWLSHLRQGAIDRFEALGVPDRRNEDFKHTPIAGVLNRDLEPGLPPAASEVPADLPGLDGSAGRLVFVDGRFAPEASTLPDGLAVESLASALRNSAGVPAWLGKCADFESRSLLALNTAWMADGAVLTAARGTRLGAPIQLVFATTAAAVGREIHLRNVVVAEPDSDLCVVEHYVGAPSDSLVNVVTEIAVEAGARVHHVKFQEAPAGSAHLSSVEVVVGRNGRFAHHSVAAGAALGRTEMRVRLEGEGAECDLAGLYFGHGSQVQDQLTVVDHASPHGTSRQVYRGILDDDAKGIFNGLVIVRPDAQKTAADQANRSLVLSERAEAHTRPQLDISADDVKCSHGSTIGALDPGALFYIRSRGIGAADARRLLIRAFAMEVFDGLEAGGLRDHAERMIAEWLA